MAKIMRLLLMQTLTLTKKQIRVLIRTLNKPKTHKSKILRETLLQVSKLTNSVTAMESDSDYDLRLHYCQKLSNWLFKFSGIASS